MLVLVIILINGPRMLTKNAGGDDGDWDEHTDDDNKAVINLFMPNQS
jgi:hypothetical protein